MSSLSALSHVDIGDDEIVYRSVGDQFHLGFRLTESQEHHVIAGTGCLLGWIVYIQNGRINVVKQLEDVSVASVAQFHHGAVLDVVSSSVFEEVHREIGIVVVDKDERFSLIRSVVQIEIQRSLRPSRPIQPPSIGS